MANCKECKDNAQISMQSKDELAFAFIERTVKRQWIAIIILICMVVVAPLAVHLGWLYYESQYETIEYSYDYQQDGQGTNIIGDENEVNNGPTVENQDKNQEEKEE